ncbi:MAG: AAA-like domain-containing protein [Cyanobacteria bacterium SBLK]|nr:AAA-like domain-containing protein [Cyanobacteria bacterium SBLK]
MSALPDRKELYKLGGSLPWSHPTYVERQADREFYEKLKRGEFCYIFNARQMGKSSLRNRIMHKLQDENVICADIDLSGIGSKNITEDQWYISILYELVNCFNLKIDLQDWWKKNKFLTFTLRLDLFLKEILLAERTENIIIFIDEIDSVLGLNFSTDDFFAFIRYWYNKRSNESVYERLTFALLGVATPSHLIQDKSLTPFNIGVAINLTGFEFEQAQPILALGLAKIVKNPNEVLSQVWKWTEGQPFLTQKICSLIVQKVKNEVPDISQLVQEYIINNWEGQDEPEHLRSIRDRLLKDKSKIGQLLEIYKQILEGKKIKANSGWEQVELKLSGLVVESQGILKIKNRIYQEIFNLKWVEEELQKLYPLLTSHQEILRTLENFVIELETKQKAQNPQIVIQYILSWTSAQKELTQIICDLILKSNMEIKFFEEEQKVNEIVRDFLIDGWKQKEEGEHLRNIENFILEDREGAILLDVYQKIQKESQVFDVNPQVTRLLELELIKKSGDRLEVHNRIYHDIFNQLWIEQMLKQLKPYSRKFKAWMQSNGEDSSQLLTKQELEQALKYVNNQKLSEDEHKFLIRSQVMNL